MSEELFLEEVKIIHVQNNSKIFVATIEDTINASTLETAVADLHELAKEMDAQVVLEAHGKRLWPNMNQKRDEVQPETTSTTPVQFRGVPAST